MIDNALLCRRPTISILRTTVQTCESYEIVSEEAPPPPMIEVCPMTEVLLMIEVLPVIEVLPMIEVFQLLF